MSSVTGRARRITFPAVEQAELRSALIACFRADARYRNVIECDLRPLWKAAEAVVVGAARDRVVKDQAAFDGLSRAFGDKDPQERNRPALVDFDRVEDVYDDQVWANEDRGEPRDTNLAAYVEALRRFVGETMRLVAAGEPAHWALPLVHGDVCGRPHWPVSAVFFGAEEVTIAVKVTPSYARVEVRDADGGTIVATELDAAGFDFDQWDELEAAAHEHLRQQLPRLRRDFDRRYPVPAYPRRNRATQRAWQAETVPALFRYLFHNQRPDEVSRDTLRRLADVIGVDLPTG